MDSTAGSADRSTRCAIAIMAKAPGAGRIKTRLSPLLSPEEARDLGCCFLTDMTWNLAAASRAAPLDGYIAFAPARSEAAFASIVHDDTGFVLADGSAPAPPGVEGFGRCLLQAADSLLALGYGAVALLNSDSPTLPTSLLVQAVRLLLQPGDAVVLGPSADGGYYLLGMKALHSGLFARIEWSTAQVARQTRRRADETGLAVIDLHAWYDVDDPGSLRHLLAELDRAGASDSHPKELSRYPAPVTAEWLARNAIRARLAGPGPTRERAVRATHAG